MCMGLFVEKLYNSKTLVSLRKTARSDNAPPKCGIVLLVYIPAIVRPTAEKRSFETMPTPSRIKVFK